MNRKTLEHNMPAAADIKAAVGYRLDPDGGRT